MLLGRCWPGLPGCRRSALRRRPCRRRRRNGLPPCPRRRLRPHLRFGRRSSSSRHAWPGRPGRSRWRRSPLSPHRTIMCRRRHLLRSPSGRRRVGCRPHRPFRRRRRIRRMRSRPFHALLRVLLASFAPVPSRAAGAASAADPRAAEPPQSVGLWGASTPERTQPGSVSPAAPMATPDGGGVAPRAFAPPAAPSAQGGGPTGGDVFLDGTRVGSWIADHLAREAGRPQAGGTAFDPRLSPAWPGTLQGN